MFIKNFKPVNPDFNDPLSFAFALPKFFFKLVVCFKREILFIKGIFKLFESGYIHFKLIMI